MKRACLLIVSLTLLLSGSLLRAGVPEGSVSVTGVTPNSGPPSGGTTVTVSGTGFDTGAAVTFGGAAATGVAFVNATTLSCTTPAHASGAVDVTVTLPSSASGTLTGGFTYTGGGGTAPTVSVVNPSSGPTAGAQSVTVTGTGFNAGATVTFGGSAATSVVVASATTITCLTPAHAAGKVDVTVTNADTLYGTLTGGYTFLAPAPTATGVSPSSGPAAGGQSVTVSGTNFLPGATVTFGGASASSVSVVSATSITCVTPPHAAGTVEVKVTNPDAQVATLAAGYTYTGTAPSPTISSVTPSSGSTAGGTPVTLSGSNFQAGASVRFGASAATSVAVASPASVTCVTPAGAAGGVDVTVTNPDSQSATLPSGFTYVASGCTLACTATVPSSGQTGQTLSFQATATPSGCTGQPSYQWTFGDNAASADQNPSHAYQSAGDFSWSLTVTLSGASPCSQYGVVHVVSGPPPPQITSVTKAASPFRLKISGSNFHAGCTVKIGGVGVPTTAYKGASLVVAKKGAALKAMVPVGTPVSITVVNNDDGGVSAPFTYTR